MCPTELFERLVVMSLLCRECDQVLGLGVGYKVIGLLGRRPSFAKSSETPISIAICSGHLSLVHESSTPEEVRDSLVFSVAKGAMGFGANFNGAFSTDQEGAIKKAASFADTVFVSAQDVEKCCPNSFAELLRTLPTFPPELSSFRDAVSRWQDEAAKRRKKRDAREDARRRRREDVSLLANTVAKNAVLRKLPVKTQWARALKAKGLMRPSTVFRTTSLFPGEAYTLWFDFRNDNQDHYGYLGFDKDFKLVSFDIRSPVEQLVDLRRASV